MLEERLWTEIGAQLLALNRRVAALERLEQHVGAFGCAFLAYNSVADLNVTGDGTVATIDFDTEVFDVGGDFAADTFTAPATGQYRLATTVFVYSLAAAHTQMGLRIVTDNRTYRLWLGSPARDATGQFQVSGSTLADMDAAHTATVTVFVANGTKVVAIYGGDIYTFFSGYRVA